MADLILIVSIIALNLDDLNTPNNTEMLRLHKTERPKYTL